MQRSGLPLRSARTTRTAFADTPRTRCPRASLVAWIACPYFWRLSGSRPGASSCWRARSCHQRSPRLLGALFIWPVDSILRIDETLFSVLLEQLNRSFLRHVGRSEDGTRSRGLMSSQTINPPGSPLFDLRQIHCRGRIEAIEYIVPLEPALSPVPCHTTGGRTLALYGASPFSASADAAWVSSDISARTPIDEFGSGTVCTPHRSRARGGKARKGQAVLILSQLQLLVLRRIMEHAPGAHLPAFPRHGRGRRFYEESSGWVVSGNERDYIEGHSS